MDLTGFSNKHIVPVCMLRIKDRRRSVFLSSFCRWRVRIFARTASSLNRCSPASLWC